MKRKKLLRISGITCLLLIALIFATDRWVTASTRDQLYTDVSKIPHRKVGLLLGTSKYVAGGSLNYYYVYRMKAAAALFKAGKIDFVLVSGDNGSKDYDEATSMQADLIALGVPKERIFLDYAGFRTLDSILRCKIVFGESNITIISQPFHNQRAVFIANHSDVSAIGFNCADINKYSGIKTQVREKFARVKMLLDLVSGKDAKFYGPKVEIR